MICRKAAYMAANISSSIIPVAGCFFDMDFSKYRIPKHFVISNMRNKTKFATMFHKDSICAYA